MRNNIKEAREEIRKERQQKEKLIEIMENYREDECEKIVKYKLFIGKDKPAPGEETDLYYRAADLLKEMKFFTITGLEKYKEVFVTGTPEFAREICEFFADYEGVSRDNIEEVGELTEEEKEEMKRVKTKDLLSDFESFKNEYKTVLNIGDNPRYKQATDAYTGKIVLEIIKERAFVDLEKGTFGRIIRILDRTDELYKDYFDQGYTINIMIDVEYSRCATLFDLLIKAFGRGNMMRCYMTVK